MPKAKSEYEVEELYIDRLDDMGYEYVDLKNYDDVCSNFRKQFCKLNAKGLIEAKGTAELSDAEFDRVMIRLENHTVYESAKILREKWVLELDNGKTVYVEFFTGETDYPAGAKKLLAQFPNIKLLNVTCGADGSYSFCCGRQVFVPSFRLGGTIETTGAGDTFCASVLHNVLAEGVENRSEESLRNMLRFANAAAYLVTTKKGAIRSMPNPAEVEAILAAN